MEKKSPSSPLKSMSLSENTIEDNKPNATITPETSPPHDGLIDLNDLNLDNFFLIKSEEEIYRLKVHKYKEIKHYIKGEVLGRGKFGTVREFIDKNTLKRYAGKIIRRYIVRKDPHLRHQINKELSITYHFNHPNILRVYDLFVNNNKIYMFMEFCFGELNEFLTFYHSLPKCQAKSYYSQTIEGLHYLHSRGIIHRDIKPENILITPDNVIKLADFGVCQEISYFTSKDVVYGNDGTPLYHPPELFHPDTIEYLGSKIDIWAAGVILYKMITGSLPFFNSNDQSASRDDIDDLLYKNVDYPSKIKSDILLIDLFNKIFEKKPHKRITISEIKKHPWMQVDLSQLKNEKYLPFPTETRNIDSYRGLTVLTRIYNKYYPPPTDERLVNFKEFKESCQLLPLARPSRYVKEQRKIQPTGHLKMKFL